MISRVGNATSTLIECQFTMDYETPDGSHFSLRAWIDPKGSVSGYTTISAYVDGIAYTGRVEREPVYVNDGDIMASLKPVPPECIHPVYQEGFTIAPASNSAEHYLKAPSFTYEDGRPGNTFVADCVLNEIKVLQRVKENPHPNIVSYLGCIVKDGRVTHLCLKRYQHTLPEDVQRQPSDKRIEELLDGIKAGIDHIHALGYAHNDINPDNICIDGDGRPVIVDFDSCLPLGEKLMKGVGSNGGSKPGAAVSRMENDFKGLDDIEGYLWTLIKGRDG